MNHEVTLAYDTTEDDGVWVECSCGWVEGLGFCPPAAGAVAAEQRHLEAVGIRA